ncbi:MAG: TIGR03557 family F420-dependent LLM class oxidoreductase [Patescibacteria group bacterium]
MSEVFYFCGHEQFQPEDIVEHAVLAEKYGFDGVMVSEHFNPWVSSKGASGFALSTLGAIASQTSRIKIITGVITPLFRYHPAVVAQAAATIDRLSNGRFMLGLGTGEMINEDPLGFEFPNYTERSERINEAIDIIQKLLKGEKVTYNGKFYKTKNAKLYSPPKHDIQIFLAAGGPKSTILAQNRVDGIITSVKKIEDTKTNVINPAEKQAESNNELLKSIFATKWSVYAHNKEDAFKSLLAWRGLRVPSRDIESDPEMLEKEADNLSIDEILNNYSIVSSSEQYIDLYKPLIKELHANYVAIQTTSLNQIDLIKMLGDKVVPELKKV